MEIEEDKLTDRKMNIFRQFHISICLSWHTVMEYNKSPPCLNLAEEHSRLIKNIKEYTITRTWGYNKVTFKGSKNDIQTQ